MADDDPWNRPTQPGVGNPTVRDIHVRHGMLMREVSELRGRVEALEHFHDNETQERERARAREAAQRRSIRPHVERIGWSVFVSAVVAGVVQGLASFFR